MRMFQRRLGLVCAGATRQRVVLAFPVTTGNKLLVLSSMTLLPLPPPPRMVSGLILLLLHVYLQKAAVQEDSSAFLVSERLDS